MANFKLNQTGEQIQADLNLLDSNSATQGQVLTANGTGGASWQNASGGTEVVANPTLSGSESDLTGLEVAGTKYKVSAGGTQKYMHSISFARETSSNDIVGSITVHIINDIATPYSSISEISFPSMAATGTIVYTKKLGVVTNAYKESGSNMISFNYRSIWDLNSSTYSSGGGFSNFIIDTWSGDTVQAL